MIVELPLNDRHVLKPLFEDYHRAKVTSAARQGVYSSAMEKVAVGD